MTNLSEVDLMDWREDTLTYSTPEVTYIMPFTALLKSFTFFCVIQ